MSTLIVYASMYGCTESCAIHIQNHLKDSVELVSAKQPGKIDLKNYKTIILGSSIMAGNIDKKLSKWIQRNTEYLLTKELYLFLCSGEANEDYFNRNFSEALLAHATLKEFFGGRLKVDSMKGFMKIIMKLAGKAVDFDHVDYGKIDTFIEHINL